LAVDEDEAAAGGDLVIEHDGDVAVGIGVERDDVAGLDLSQFCRGECGAAELEAQGDVGVGRWEAGWSGELGVGGHVSPSLANRPERVGHGPCARASSGEMAGQSRVGWRKSGT